MNRRERVIAALNLEEPDQVPTHVIAENCPIFNKNLYS